MVYRQGTRQSSIAYSDPTAMEGMLVNMLDLPMDINNYVDVEDGFVDIDNIISLSTIMQEYFPSGLYYPDEIVYKTYSLKETNKVLEVDKHNLLKLNNSLLHIIESVIQKFSIQELNHSVMFKRFLSDFGVLLILNLLNRKNTKNSFFDIDIKTNTDFLSRLVNVIAIGIYTTALQVSIIEEKDLYINHLSNFSLFEFVVESVYTIMEENGIMENIESCVDILYGEISASYLDPRDVAYGMYFNYLMFTDKLRAI